MTNLLYAGVMRLHKSKIFWLGLFFMFGFGIYTVLINYFPMISYNDTEFLDSHLFIYVPTIGCCCAVFCSLFSGTEYSDGTIRNKITIGHTRKNIYLSNLLISIMAALLMEIAYLLSFCSLGVLLFEAPQMQITELIFYIVVSLFTVISFTALFNMLSMLITKKSTSAVVCLLVFLGVTIGVAFLQSKLAEPELTYPTIRTSFSSVTMYSGDGTDMIPNPKYLQGTERAVYQFLFDFTPFGQSIQFPLKNVIHPVQMIIYSLFITIVTSVGGILAFNKKDLK